MSADSLKNNITNPARVYLWEVIIPTPPKGDTQTYLLRAQSTSQPGRSFGKIHVPFKQSGGVEFPGKLTYSHEWSVTFIEGEDRALLVAMNAWMNRVIHERYMIGYPNFKTDLYLHLINTDGSVAKKIKMIGCFPMELQEVEMDYNSETEMKFTSKFSYDRWELV